MSKLRSQQPARQLENIFKVQLGKIGRDVLNKFEDHLEDGFPARLEDEEGTLIDDVYDWCMDEFRITMRQ